VVTGTRWHVEEVEVASLDLCTDPDGLGFHHRVCLAKRTRLDDPFPWWCASRFTLPSRSSRPIVGCEAERRKCRSRLRCLPSPADQPDIRGRAREAANEVAECHRDQPPWRPPQADWVNSRQVRGAVRSSDCVLTVQRALFTWPRHGSNSPDATLFGNGSSRVAFGGIGNGTDGAAVAKDDSKRGAFARKGWCGA